MLALIGGLMLASAVGAMILLAGWSLAYDDDPDSRPRDGILALRDWSALTKKRKAPGKSPAKLRRANKPRRQAGTARDGLAIQKLGTPRFAAEEMAEVEGDIIRQEQEMIQAEHEAALAEFSIRHKRQGTPA